MLSFQRIFALGSTFLYYLRFKLPIWITEFAVADWERSPKHCEGECVNRNPSNFVAEFVRIVLPELEARNYVRRYAWFAIANGRPQLSSSALIEAEDLTDLGKYYAGFDGVRFNFKKPE